MSQRQHEIVLVSVPETFSEYDKEQFKKLLIKATSHTNWENLTIVISSKTFKAMNVSAQTYDEIEKLRKEGKHVQLHSGRVDTGRTDKYSDETPEKDAEDYKEDNPYIKFRQDGKGNPRNKPLKWEN